MKFFKDPPKPEDEITDKMRKESTELCKKYNEKDQSFREELSRKTEPFMKEIREAQVELAAAQAVRDFQRCQDAVTKTKQAQNSVGHIKAEMQKSVDSLRDQIHKLNGPIIKQFTEELDVQVARLPQPAFERDHVDKTVDPAYDKHYVRTNETSRLRVQGYLLDAKKAVMEMTNSSIPEIEAKIQDILSNLPDLSIEIVETTADVYERGPVRPSQDGPSEQKILMDSGKVINIESQQEKDIKEVKQGLEKMQEPYLDWKLQQLKKQIKK